MTSQVWYRSHEPSHVDIVSIEVYHSASRQRDLPSYSCLMSVPLTAIGEKG